MAAMMITPKEEMVLGDCSLDLLDGEAKSPIQPLKPILKETLLSLSLPHTPSKKRSRMSEWMQTLRSADCKFTDPHPVNLFSGGGECAAVKKVNGWSLSRSETLSGEDGLLPILSRYETPPSEDSHSINHSFAGGECISGQVDWVPQICWLCGLLVPPSKPLSDDEAEKLKAHVLSGMWRQESKVDELDGRDVFLGKFGDVDVAAFFMQFAPHNLVTVLLLQLYISMACFMLP